MNLRHCDRNIFVEIKHFAGDGGPVVAIDGDALAAFEVERSGLLQDLISTAGSAEIPLHQKAFALYQKFQHAPVHEMDELSGVIQVLAFYIHLTLPCPVILHETFSKQHSFKFSYLSAKWQLMQAASFLEDRETHQRACHAAAHRLNAAFRQHCSDAVPPAERLLHLPHPASLSPAYRSGVAELFRPMVDLSVADLEAILSSVHLSVTAGAPKRIRDAAISCRSRNSMLDLADALTSTCSTYVPGPRQSHSQVAHIFCPAIIYSYLDSIFTHPYTALSLANNALTAPQLPTIVPLLSPPLSPLLCLDISSNPSLSCNSIATLLPHCPSLTRLALTCIHSHCPAPVEALADALRGLESLHHITLSTTTVSDANVLLDSIAGLPICRLELTSPFVDITAPDEPAVLELPELLSDLSKLTALHISDRVECCTQQRAPDECESEMGASPGDLAPARGSEAAELELEELSRFTWALLAALPRVPDLEVLRVHAAHGAMLRAPAVCTCYCVLLSLFRLTELALPGCDRDRIAPVLLRMRALRTLDVSDDPHDNSAAQAAVLQRRRLTLRQALAAEAAGSRLAAAAAAAPADPVLGLTKLTALRDLACTRVHCGNATLRRSSTPPPLPASPSPVATGAVQVPLPRRAALADCTCMDPASGAGSARASPRTGLLSAALSSSFNGSCVNTISAAAADSTVAPTSLERSCGALASLRSLSLCESSCGPLVETSAPHPLRPITPGTSAAFSLCRSTFSGPPSVSDSDFETSSESEANTSRGTNELDEDYGVTALAEPFLRLQFQLTRLELCHVRRLRSLLCGLANFAPELRELTLASTSSAAECAERFDAVPSSSRALRGALRPLHGLTAIALRATPVELVPAILRCVAGAPALRRLELTVCCPEGDEWDGAGFVEDLRVAAEYAFRRLTVLEDLVLGHRAFAGGDRLLIEMLRSGAVARLRRLQSLLVGLRQPPPQDWCRGLWQAVKALPMQRGVQLMQPRC